MSSASGSLHQLDPVCAVVLSLLETGACSADSLLAALVEGAGQAPPPNGSPTWPAALGRALQHLRTHDLVAGGTP
jgi:hypothetical protein